VRRVHLAIKGRVQGVYFRQSARRQAESLGIRGWVRNRSDGTVEAVAQGKPDAVELFVKWCHSGPELADVSAVERRDSEPVELPEGFDVRPSL
jgi:acylphosphatase